MGCCTYVLDIFIEAWKVDNFTELKKVYKCIHVWEILDIYVYLVLYMFYFTVCLFF